jgi:hypothetical protein
MERRMTIMKIRLELARDKDFPSGSTRHGYEFSAPLDERGNIDRSEWQQHRDQCRVHRFWENEGDEVGHLIRKPGGNWAFHYDINGDEEDDETGYRFGDHAFNLGEYVSIMEHDDVLRTFRVISIQEAA